MLIDKPPAPGDIVSFRLTSGEEVVGSFRRLTTKGYAIGRPVLLGMQQVGPQQAQIAFGPFMASLDEEQPVIFPETTLTIIPVPCRADIANNYRRITTGLATASAAEAEAVAKSGKLVL